MYENRYASREDIDAAMRLGCGLPMGPLALMDLIGIDTAYEILDTMYKQSRNRLHAPSPVIKQMMTAGLLGRKTGRGFYTYAEPGSAEVVADAATPAGGRRHRGRPAGAQGRRRRLRHHGHRHHRGRRQGRLRRHASSPAPPTRSRPCRRRWPSRWTSRSPRGRLEEAARDEILGRVTGTTKLDDLADVDLVIEAVVEHLRHKQALFANLGEIAKPGAVLATTTSSLPVIECAKASERPADVVGMHFFNPAQVMKLVEVVSHDRHRARRRRHRARACASSWASTRSPAPTAPASSSTRCCSPTSTTR